MKLTYKNSSIDFIIKQWDVQNYLKIENTNFNSLFKNGSTVVLAKKENYDCRYVFVRSVNKFVSVCKDLQTYCINGNLCLFLLYSHCNISLFIYYY